MANSVEVKIIALRLHYVLFSAAVDFFNQVNILYGTLTEFCTPSNCPKMTAGPKYNSDPSTPCVFLLKIVKHLDSQSFLLCLASKLLTFPALYKIILF